MPRQFQRYLAIAIGVIVCALSVMLVGQPQVQAQDLPGISFTRDGLPRVVAHIAQAQAAGYPSVLTRARRQPIRGCSDIVPRLGLGRIDPDALVCHPYPFGNTREGRNPSIGEVSLGEKFIQEAILNVSFRLSRINQGDRFRVILPQHSR